MKASASLTLDAIDRRLLNDFQRDFPLCPQPFAAIGKQLGISEAQVLQRLKRLMQAGAISRIGPVLQPQRVGASTLAAMAVPPERLESVAALVNSFREVNHNYERLHPFNLWFVLTASDETRIQEILQEIQQRTGLPVLDLPMIESYHIDLGFPLW